MKYKVLCKARKAKSILCVKDVPIEIKSIPCLVWKAKAKLLLPLPCLRKMECGHGTLTAHSTSTGSVTSSDQRSTKRFLNSDFLSISFFI